MIATRQNSRVTSKRVKIFLSWFVSLFLTVPNVHGDNDFQGRLVHPNIVFILADDLGWGELGCYGQDKIKTPHIDLLATQGIRLTQHYSGAPVCAPSRCVLMTGRQLHRAEIRGNRDSGRGGAFPGQWPMTDSAVTIAEVLQQHGYVTGGFGKWGLGPTDSSGSPMRQGFDRFYGYNCQRNAHSYYPEFLNDDAGIERINDRPIPGHRIQPDGDVRAADYRSKTYAPDLILEEAIEFIDQHRDRPFFLYLPFVEPHVAMHPPQEWIDRYPMEWDAELGPYRGENGYLPHPRSRAGYAAMISQLDHHVGTILQKLQQHGLSENTLVIFTSDNGPTHGGKDSRFSVGGAACEFFNSTGGLKGFKGSCYEGGLRVPCIVRWPNKIKPGTETAFPSCFADWMVTISEASESKIPVNYEHDGVSLVQVLQGSGLKQRKSPMIWDFVDYGGMVAIRSADFKAIRRGLNTKKPGAWELYNVEADPSELSDLAADHPGKISELEAMLIKSRVNSAVFPNPIYDRE